MTSNAPFSHGRNPYPYEPHGHTACTASVIGFVLVVREFVREWGRFGAGLTYGNDPVFLFPAIEIRRIARILFLRRIFAVLYSAVGTHTASYAV
jgi:hypothetical protein